MGLKDREADPQYPISQEVVNEILEAWKEDFLAQPKQQFRINLKKGEYDKKYVVGASTLPDRPNKFHELDGEKKENC